MAYGGGGGQGKISGGGGISFFRLVPKSPPPPEMLLRNLGHFLLPGSAANSFLLQGGTGARVLHVRISLYAGVRPETFFLCILRIPKNDFVYPVCIPQAAFVYQLCIPRTELPATVHKAPKFGGADILPTRQFLRRNPPSPPGKPLL